MVVGQDRFLERVLIAMLAQGHLLVEGVPGLAKTLTVKTLARTMRGSFKRIQFTPTWCPPTWWARASTTRRPARFGTSSAWCSPTCCWPTRSTARPPRCSRAARGDAGAPGDDRRRHHPVPEPFVVMATQNPIETEGTYPLPEAQVDRFMMKVLVDYPPTEEEFVIAERVTGPPSR